MMRNCYCFTDKFIKPVCKKNNQLITIKPSANEQEDSQEVFIKTD